MRTYLSQPNLVNAAKLAAVVTLMTVPRLIQGAMPLGLFLPFTFLAMLFVGGAVTAWGRSAGMAGIRTDRRTFLTGAAIAGALTAVALPLQVFWLDPILRQALTGEMGRPFLALSYPTTVAGCVAVILWSAGFQAIFLHAAPMSFFTRLTGRPSLAFSLCLALRVYVAYRQVLMAGMIDGVGAFVVASAAAAAAGAILFARFGLGPTMLFAAGQDLHLLLR